jgi:GntR family transcriptional regulator, uxu operon transcriptional repressor
MDDNKRLYQTIGEQLRTALQSGTYPTGERLPPERLIAEQFGVSRSVVREALIMLELEGWVEVRQGSGVYARGGEHTRTAADDIGPFELLQARQLLESNVAAFAATQVTKANLVEMRRALEQERQNLADESTSDEADEHFHLLIAEATQNSLLRDLVQQLWERRANSPMWKQLHARIISQDYRARWLEDHNQILLALQRRDPHGARHAMWQHLENVKQSLLILSDVENPDFDGYLFATDPVTWAESLPQTTP